MKYQPLGGPTSMRDFALLNMSPLEIERTSYGDVRNMQNTLKGLEEL